MDDVAWGVLTFGLTLLGGIWTWFAYQRRGLAAGLRGAGLTLLPLAAYFTKTLKMFGRIVDAVGDWATDLVFSPRVWVGVVLAGVAGVLYVAGRALERAQRPTPEPSRSRSRASRRGRWRPPPARTPTWPTSKRSCAAAESPDVARLRRPQPPVVAAPRRRGCPRPRAPSSPVMVVDLDAFDANAEDLRRRAGGTPIRLASKSVRVPALIRRGLGSRRLPGRARPTPWPRRSGSRRTRSATTSSSPTRPWTGPR